MLILLSVLAACGSSATPELTLNAAPPPSKIASPTISPTLVPTPTPKPVPTSNQIPTPEVTPTPTQIARPAANPPVSEIPVCATGNDLPDDVCIGPLSSPVAPGGEMYLSVRFIMSPAPAKVEVYYPGAETPVVVVPKSEHDFKMYSWTWLVPADTPSGEATVVVTATPAGGTIVRTKTFLVGNQASSP